jgi:hypothetical protein
VRIIWPALRSCAAIRPLPLLGIFSIFKREVDVGAAMVIVYGWIVYTSQVLRFGNVMSKVVWQVGYDWRGRIGKRREWTFIDLILQERELNILLLG